MTVIHREQIPLKYHNKAGNREVELALIGIEVMEEVQQMAGQKRVHFLLDVDDGFDCRIQCDKSYLESGLKLLAEIYLENCHSGNEVRMKVTDSGFCLKAMYVEFSDDILDLLNGKPCSDREIVQKVQVFYNYIAQLNGIIKTHCDESGCNTEIMLQAY